MQDLSWSALSALLLAMFAVSVGYSIVLPILPFMIARLAGTADAVSPSWHTGLLTSAYFLASGASPHLKVSARCWGSTGGGLLFDVSIIPNATFNAAAIIVLTGAAASFGLPRRLMPPSSQAHRCPSSAPSG